MASEFSFQCRHNNNNDGIVTQTLNDIIGKVCAEENCGASSNTVDENQCTIISNATIVPCENMVPSAVKPEGINGLQWAPAAVGDKRSSVELKITDGGMIVENGAVEAGTTSINEKECIVRPDAICIESHDSKMNGEVSKNVTNEPCIIKHEVRYDCYETRLHNNLVDAEQIGDGNTRNNLVSNSLVSNNLISNNQSHNEQSISAKQNLPNKHPSVNHKQNLTNGRPIPPDDLLYVLSVVQEDMRGMGISRVNGGTEGRQLLTNGASNKVIDSEKKDLDEVVSTDESDSSEDSSSSSSESSSDESNSKSNGDAVIRRAEMAKEEHNFLPAPPKTKDEICISDLPHLEPLDVFVDESIKLSPMGEIESIMLEDAIVIIKSFENVPALDSDTILFSEDRSGFGRVFEIFGQVRNPHYCIRFNNQGEIKSTNVEIGQTIFFAPDTKDLTTFVFVSKLNSVKGTDASWEHDQEPPNGALEFSDDEAESSVKSAKKRANKLKKRNEAHMQQQMQGQTEAATSIKKERPSTPPIKDPQTTPSPRPGQGGQFPCPPHQHLQPALRLPPKPLIPPQSIPRGPPHRFGDQHQPFHPPPRGPPFHPHMQYPPRFTGELSQRPPPRNYIIPHGSLPHGHPMQHFGPPNPGAPLYHPPPQFNEMWGQPFQNFPPPPQPNLGIAPHNQLPPRPNWDGPPPRPNWDGPPNLGPRPWENAFPNGPPMNQQQWPCGQPQLPPGLPYIKQEPPQNTQMPQSRNLSEPPENVKAYLNT